MTDPWAEFAQTQTAPAQADPWSEFKPAASFNERFDAGNQPSNPDLKLALQNRSTVEEPDDHGRSKRANYGVTERLLQPALEYPETYGRMRHEAQDMMSSGADQVMHPDSAVDFAKGAGKAVLGAASFVASPISAAYRTQVGQPIEDVTGIPREYPEFAAQLATPGIGLASVGGKGAPVVKAVEGAVPSTAELKAAAKIGYKDPAFKDLTISSKPVAQFADETAVKLGQEGFDPIVAPKTHDVLTRLQKAPDDSEFTGQNFHTVRKTLRKIANAGDPSEKAAAVTAIDALDAMLPAVKQGDVISGDAAAASRVLKDANANYAASERSKAIEKLIQKAERQAGSSNSGMNLANTLRQRLRSFIDNPKKSGGFSEEELAHIDSIIMGTNEGNAARKASNIMGGGGGLGALAAGAVGSSLAGPVGYLTPFVGQALKSWTNKAALADVNKLAEAVRTRAPLSSSMEKWEVAAARVGKGGRAAQNFSGAVIAARNLSNNLKDAGFSVHPSEILRSLQGPVGAGAGDEQQ